MLNLNLGGFSIVAGKIYIISIAESKLNVFLLKALIRNVNFGGKNIVRSTMFEIILR